MSVFGPRGVSLAVLDDAAARAGRMRAAMEPVKPHNSLTYLGGGSGIARELYEFGESLARVEGKRDYGRMATEMHADLGPLAWGAGALRNASQVDAAWIERSIGRHLDRLDATIDAARATRPWWSPDAPPRITGVDDATRAPSLLGPRPELPNEAYGTVYEHSEAQSIALTMHYSLGLTRGLTQRASLPMLLNEPATTMFDSIAARMASGTALDQNAATFTELWPDVVAARAAATLDEPSAQRVGMALLDRGVATPRMMGESLQHVRDRVQGMVIDRPELQGFKDTTIQLIDRNLARINRTDRGPVVGYDNYPDLAEIGAIKANMQLLERAERPESLQAARSGTINW